jgi:integral membrane protein
MKANLLTSAIGRLRLVAFLEGLSFLVLLLIAMPLKYWADMPQMVKVTGMFHGILFVAYVIFVLEVKLVHKWANKKTFGALVASVIPFGTFYADAKWFKNQQDTNA